MENADIEVAIVGGGIGGLTLALALDEVDVRCRVFEQAELLRPLGVGINLLPHAMKVFDGLGIAERLEDAGVLPRTAAFYNRFGQLIHDEPLGRACGYEWPQVSIHRGDLQLILADAVKERLGTNALVLGHRCTSVGQDDSGAYVELERFSDGEILQQRASLVIGCDGVHSKVREILFGKSALRYSGIHMWRGTTIMDPVLDGATMVRAGWFPTGKLVIYPIVDNVQGTGRQLVNWTAEVEEDRYQDRDWNREGDADDFIDYFADWHFDWLDAPAMIRQANVILEYPMVDQTPLESWTDGRITLLGDAAHPMVPRGSNGAGQAILDVAEIAKLIADQGLTPDALEAYEDARRPMAATVVEVNNTNPPDAILGLVYERTGDQPFDDINDVATSEELTSITDRYKDVAGYSKADL